VAVRRDDEAHGSGRTVRTPTGRATGDNTLRWPSLEREAPPARRERLSKDAGITGPADARPVQARSFVAMPAFPEPVHEGGDDGATRASPRVEPEVPEEDRWPELPNTGWGEDTWQGPSSRSLVREQLRLTRLLAEQAGSSWSAPRS